MDLSNVLELQGLLEDESERSAMMLTRSSVSVRCGS
jgi:hypothetical protein